MKSGQFEKLDLALWSGLSFGIVEQVLSSLPVPHLCRYRTVCKTWNQLIQSPRFGALFAQNAAKYDASIFVLSGSELFGKRRNMWYFLDLDARRWYSTKNKYPCHHTSKESIAMDGGLICQLMHDNLGFKNVIVYNPIAEAKRKLPGYPIHLTARTDPYLNLVVDNTLQQFKVFLINRCVLPENSEHPRIISGEHLRIQDDPLMLIYDSSTNEWRRSTNPSCLSHCGISDVHCSVMFQGFLYILLAGWEIRDEYELWRYNLSVDAWETTMTASNRITTSKLLSPTLFVSTNRLFFMAWLIDNLGNNLSWRLEVSEIRGLGLDQERLFEMSGASVIERLDVSPTYNGTMYTIIAPSFGNSLLFIHAASGKSLVFDLETRLWDQLCGEETPLNSDIFNSNTKPLTLILPSKIWWQGGQGIADDQN